ncbi:HDIG domain-containing metalloprotein [Paenibacillus terreus]|uniref:HDIG domain-containing metalloprotein n=1 Tax=Paenibacillus terreus TaxID=1387834 RepID=A0ABV5BDH7_9BACL
MNSVLEPYVKDLKITGDLEADIKSFFLSHGDPETLDHTLKVANEAEQVAKMYNVDPEKAKQAGLLHDISNVVPVREMMRVAEELSGGRQDMFDSNGCGRCYLDKNAGFQDVTVAGELIPLFLQVKGLFRQNRLSYNR